MLTDNNKPRPRATDLDLSIGILPHGDNNTITDVPHVAVGHSTIISGEGQLMPGSGPIRSGITAITPHKGNIFKEKVPASAHTFNGFGKSIGLMQLIELGTIETPIIITSTLSTWKIGDALIDILSENNPGVQSFNPIICESNDRFLNDGVGRHLTKEHLQEALNSVSSQSTEEGNVGVGTGMTGFGWKGGIGTSSRVCQSLIDTYHVGVLVVCNAGDPRDLRFDNISIGKTLLPPGHHDESGGSMIFIVATDAPVNSRQLNRMAKRAEIGFSRCGGVLSHSSGSFSIAFSSSGERPRVDDAHLTPLFRGVIEASEEAIINSILRSDTMIGRDGNIRHGIPIDKIKEIQKRMPDTLDKYPEEN